MRFRKPHRAAWLFIAALALGAVPRAAAQEKQSEESGYQIAPASRIDVGVTGVMGDTRYFGAFNDMHDNKWYPAADADIALGEYATGTWLWFSARNLGLGTRELRFEHERQGDWRFFVDLSQSTYRNPLEVTTGLTGIGTPEQSVSGTALREVDLETQRDRLETGLTKQIGPNLSVKVDFRQEEKSGERQWGTQGFNFLTEPVDYITREITGTANYTGRRLQLTGGYIGSFFTSAHEVLDNDSSQPQVALPPDNTAHQVHLAGTYALTPTTRATFKASYGIAIQNESFFTAPTFPGNTRSDLGGQVNTTLAQFGLSARPMPKLAVNAKLRYEDRDDRTDIAQYITPSASRSGFNIPFSRTTLTGNLEAIYTLPERFRVIGRLKQENWDRSKPVLRHASFRDETYETSYEVELRRAIVDSLGGSVSYTRSVRNGSQWRDGTSGEIDAINLGDRERDKVRLSLSWAPQERFTAQLSLEYSEDIYDSRPLGPRSASKLLASVDVGYQVSPQWHANAWATLSDFRFDQASNGDGTDAGGGAITDEDWAADLAHIGFAAGFALRGRLTDNLSTGLEAQYTTDRSKHDLTGLEGSEIPDLPDIRYRQATAGAFLDYKISASQWIRLRYGYARIMAEDWTWLTWTYADGTTVTTPDREETHFIGIAYSHRW